MDCRDIANKIWLYVEGDLTPRKQSLVARHVASCPECAALVEAATNSQQWLRSNEPGPFDDAVLDQVRRGARQKIAELRTNRFQYLIEFARLNWKPLIIACPVTLLICWLALHLVLDTSREPRQLVQALESDGSGRGGVRHNVGPSIDVTKPPSVRYAGVTHLRRRIARHAHGGPPAKLADPGELIANGETSRPPLRIEIQTQDPDIRIIWFASPGDGSAPFGPDK
jgi:anti-sigma factor RsiW